MKRTGRPTRSPLDAALRVAQRQQISRARRIAREAKREEARALAAWGRKQEQAAQDIAQVFQRIAQVAQQAAEALRHMFDGLTRAAQCVIRWLTWPSWKGTNRLHFLRGRFDDLLLNTTPEGGEQWQPLKRVFAVW